MRCLSWFYNSKIINTSQLTEKLKVKAASMKINAKGMAITKKSLFAEKDITTKTA
jgi:hypothetical protein